MLKNRDYKTSRDFLLPKVRVCETERIPLQEAAGRILAEDLLASENVPSFNRSAYDGYALRAEDLKTADREHPVTLRILEEIPAGSVPTLPLTEGTASKILTGAPVPEGATAVVPYEITEFTTETVTCFKPVSNMANIILIGEDVKKGTVLAQAGTKIDAGVAGCLAAQGVREPLVYRKPKIGLVSTGSELISLEENPIPGKIYNTNEYTLFTALQEIGCDVIRLGIAEDSVQEIAELFTRGLAECDAVISTGGVSVGDYDLTPDAQQMAGAELLISGVSIKPGMACSFAEKDGKLLMGLSGHPSSSMTLFWCVCLSLIRKMQGRQDYLPIETEMILKKRFGKSSRCDRLLRGYLEFDEGKLGFVPSSGQGNVVLSGNIGTNAIAVIPAGSGPVEEGVILNGFLLF